MANYLKLNELTPQYEFTKLIRAEMSEFHQDDILISFDFMGENGQLNLQKERSKNPMIRRVPRWLEDQLRKTKHMQIMTYGNTQNTEPD